MTQEQLNKLPKFAQEYIRKIERERELAVRQLNEFVDGQTESKIWVDEAVCTGEESGPSFKRHYIQAHRLTFKVGNEEVDVALALNGAAEMYINCGGSQMTFQPTASNQIRILG